MDSKDSSLERSRLPISRRQFIVASSVALLGGTVGDSNGEQSGDKPELALNGGPKSIKPPGKLQFYLIKYVLNKKTSPWEVEIFYRKTIWFLDYQVEVLTELSQAVFCLMNPDFAADYSLRPCSSYTESNLRPASFPSLTLVDLD